MFRSVFDSLLPPGSIWTLKEGGDFDLLMDGISDNYDSVRTFLNTLAFLRDPQRTSILTDLEREYGVVPNSNLSEQERRDRLTVQKNDRISDGSPDTLQQYLRDSGFDVYVYQNDPAVDPEIIVSLSKIYCDGYNAYCGRTDAYAQKFFTLIINGLSGFLDYPSLKSPYKTYCGDSAAYCGRPDAYCQKLLIELADSDYWHLIFFIGGSVTRDPVTDEITYMEAASIPWDRRLEFVKLIMKYKPLHSWGAAKIIFT